MHKIPAFTLALALACGGALAAASHDTDPPPANGSATLHKMGAEMRSALHKLGAATRHALHRADSAVQRRDRHAALEDDR